MSKANYQIAADMLDQWRDDVLSGKPRLFPVGAGDLERLEIGPGLVTLHRNATANPFGSPTITLVRDRPNLDSSPSP
jgi:hypothetical protein